MKRAQIRLTYHGGQDLHSEDIEARTAIGVLTPHDFRNLTRTLSWFLGLVHPLDTSARPE